MLLSLSSAGVFAIPTLNARQVNKSLAVFTVLQVPDMHYTGDATRILSFLLETKSKMSNSFMYGFLESLYLFHLKDEASVKKAIDTYTSAVVAREIPWAIVFGNHDEGVRLKDTSLTIVLTTSMSRHSMLEYARQRPFAHFESGPPDVKGCGNYELQVQSGNMTAFRMYFIDTGVDGTIDSSQIKYLKALAAAHSDEVAPAILFAHIPIPEFKLQRGESVIHGFKREKVSAGHQDGLLDAMVQSKFQDILCVLCAYVVGNVKAMFVGHDHGNTYCVSRRGVELCYGGGVGYGAAYAVSERTARVIQWRSTNNDSAMSTWVLSDGDFVKREYTLPGPRTAQQSIPPPISCATSVSVHIVFFAITAQTSLAQNLSNYSLYAQESQTDSGPELSFTVLQIPDMHYTGDANRACRGPSHDPCTESDMTKFIASLLDNVKPDLVVFTGDQTREEVKKAIDTYSAQVIARKIPWAMVFGNHDEGGSMSRLEMLTYIAQLPYSYSQFGPTNIGGVGNFELMVSTRRAMNTAFRMYFIDTGIDGAVSSGQLRFLRNLSGAHNDSAPAILFAHIPPPEYNVDPDEQLQHGKKGEAVVSGPQSGLFDSLVEMGDVKAMFVGHDHDNNYCVERSGIELCYGGGSGYGAAYNLAQAPRTARVIQWKRNQFGDGISTWIQTDGDFTKHEYPLFGLEKDCRSSVKQEQIPHSHALHAQVTTAVDASEHTFTVLQIPDMHYTGTATYNCEDPWHDPCTEADMTAFIAALLDNVEPDLVVFTGDQVENQMVIHTPDEVKKAIDAYSAQVIARKIPWAMIFGNHDEGDSMSRQDMLNYITRLPYSYSQFGPKDINGTSNFELEVAAGPDNSTAFRMYFIDTGLKGAISSGQLSYLRNISSAHNDSVPAILFAHFPPPEYDVDEEDIQQGKKGEHVSSGPQSGLFDTLIEMGDVKAMFVGHDHLNDYCAERQGISLCYGGGVGYGIAYNTAGSPRSARVVQWQQTSSREVISTWTLRDGDYTKDELHLFVAENSKNTTTQKEPTTQTNHRNPNELAVPFVAFACFLWAV
ncbi:hypothetical protein ACHHYP_16258 [Achlya hypogyna]|uniref:Calcineurin-like phosphoesterase domain-containing protein n=1 Tax=Achlya hypogyna TaxID=1202772 RepID=A0A1V9Y9G3_ACHHY|nr:hypothetical protein ACHHYP_16258 [Achlya hypogyna]